jgi:hypothetical protein
MMAENTESAIPVWSERNKGTVISVKFSETSKAHTAHVAFLVAGGHIEFELSGRKLHDTNSLRIRHQQQALEVPISVSVNTTSQPVFFRVDRVYYSWIERMYAEEIK